MTACGDGRRWLRAEAQAGSHGEGLSKSRTGSFDDSCVRARRPSGCTRLPYTGLHGNSHKFTEFPVENNPVSTLHPGFSASKTTHSTSPSEASPSRQHTLSLPLPTQTTTIMSVRTNAHTNARTNVRTNVNSLVYAPSSFSWKVESELRGHPSLSNGYRLRAYVGGRVLRRRDRNAIYHVPIWSETELRRLTRANPVPLQESDAAPTHQTNA